MKIQVVKRITLAFVEHPDLEHTFDLTVRRGGKTVVDWAVGVGKDMHLTYRTPLIVKHVEYDDVVATKGELLGIAEPQVFERQKVEFAL